MKKLVLLTIIISLFIANESIAQIPFERTYGGSDDNSADAYLLKANPNGDILWTRPYDEGFIQQIITGNNQLISGDENWTTTGPYGGEVYALKADPTNPNIIYAGTNRGGIFKSTDGGETWAAINEGLADYTSNIHFSVFEIEIDPINTNIIYIGCWFVGKKGVFKSTDGGENWQDISEEIIYGSCTTIQDIVISPTNTNILYFGLFEHDGKSLFKSVNAGISWDVTTFQHNVKSIMINIEDPEIILVGTMFNGIKKSTDGGITWTETNMTSGRICELRADPIDPYKAYAGTPSGIYKTIDGGETWDLIGINTLWVYSIAIKENEPNIYVGTSNGVFKSIDNGSTWEEVSAGITHSGISAVEFGSQGKILAGSYEYGGGIFVSSNAGENWVSSNTGLTAIEIRFILPDLQNSDVIFIGTNGRGLQKSIDGGLTWQEINNGLPLNATAISGAIDPQNGDILYAGVCKDYPDQGLYKSTDGGISWLPTTLINKYVWSIAIDPFETNTIYAGTYCDDIYKSIDGGLNWTATGIGDGITTDIVFDPFNSSILYAADMDKDKVYKSEDGGSSWAQTGFVGETPWSVTIDPFENTTMFVGGWRGIYKSTDGGTTFNLTSLGSILNPGAVVNAIVIDPLDPNVIFAGATSGMGFWAAKTWKSEDGGTTWDKLTNGLPEATNVRCLAIVYDDQQKIRTLYLGADAGGASLYAYSEHITAIEEDNLSEDIEGTFLSQNCPNPFNIKTTIQFTTADSDNNTNITIYNFNGQKIKTLVNKKLNEGTHQVVWDGTDDSGNPLSSGIYLYKMQNNNINETKRMILLR